jgi:hypothetical protein
MTQICEYCEEDYEVKNSDAIDKERFCTRHHEELEDNYRKCEEAADRKF